MRLAGFSCDEAQFLGGKINILPRQRSDIREACPGVETDKDHASPFLVGHREDRAKFIHGEGTPRPFLSALADGFHILCRIISDQSVALCGEEKHLHRLQVMIHRFRGELLRLMVSKIQNVLAGDFGQIRIGQSTEVREKLIRSIRVEIESGFRNFVPLSREPRLGKGAKRFVDQLLSRDFSISGGDDLSNLPGRALPRVSRLEMLSQFLRFAAISRLRAAVTAPPGVIGELRDPESALR